MLLKKVTYSTTIWMLLYFWMSANYIFVIFKLWLISIIYLWYQYQLQWILIIADYIRTKTKRSNENFHDTVNNWENLGSEIPGLVWGRSPVDWSWLRVELPRFALIGDWQGLHLAGEWLASRCLDTRPDAHMRLQADSHPGWHQTSPDVGQNGGWTKPRGTG